jgi:hypothetical protein
MTKHARDMDEAERKATLAALKRGQLPEPPPPTDGPKKAREMTEAQRQEWFRQHKKSYGG